MDFPGIDKEAKFGGKTPLMLLDDLELPCFLAHRPDLQNMLSEEQRRRRENKKREETKGGVFNEAEKWKEMKVTRRKQKEAVEELMRKNKEAEEEMSKEGKMRKEKVEKEFQDKIEPLVKEIKRMKVEKQKRIAQINKEQVEGQKALSAANQDKLNKLVQKHKAENADMVENILDNADDEAEDDVEAEEAEDKALVAPDCPICYETMSPPMRIFQCGAGHLVCVTCRQRLKVFQKP